MEKILKVDGMMCGHCEARVKKCLEEIDGVIEAVANHEAGTVLVKADGTVSDEALKNAVEDCGFVVIG